MQSYKWKITPRSNQLLIELEAAKLLFDNLKSFPNLETNLRKTALLKSAVFSARVEGFSDTLFLPKKESQNLLSAYQLIHSRELPQKITISSIRKFHNLALKSLSSMAGKWRTEPWAIFNQVGLVIYLAPPAQEIPQLMSEYVKYINSLKVHTAVKAALAQFVFEKIHSFADGNGRVGRLISAFILERNGFGFKGQVPFEEYIDRHREVYYSNLEPSSDCTGFIEFFLEALVFQSKTIFEKLNTSPEENAEDSLLPRRREIVNVIRDHPNCTFDFLHRRFLAINIKTLHFDLSELIKTGFVKKIGSTKGAVYSPRNIHS